MMYPVYQPFKLLDNTVYCLLGYIDIEEIKYPIFDLYPMNISSIKQTTLSLNNKIKKYRFKTLYVNNCDKILIYIGNELFPNELLCESYNKKSYIITFDDDVSSLLPATNVYIHNIVLDIDVIDAIQAFDYNYFHLVIHIDQIAPIRLFNLAVNINKSDKRMLERYSNVFVYKNSCIPLCRLLDIERPSAL